MGQDTKDRITNPTGSKLGGNPFAGDDTNNGNPTGSKLGGVPEDVLSQQSTQTIVQQPKVEQQKQTHENGGTKPKANNGEPPVNDGSAKVAPAQGTTQNQVGATSPESVQKESATPNVQKTMSYEDMFRASNPYTPPTPEELEKERKKKKREAIFAAIGDGVSALANLYFTSQGAFNSYDPKNSMSAKFKERWDKVQKERDANNKYYYNGVMQARQADDAVARDNRNWEYKVGRDKLADERYTAEQAESKRRYDESVKERAAARKAEGERWQKQFDENQRQFNQNQSRLKQQSKEQAAARIATAQAAAARGVRGKQLGFADGNGNQVSIYENVWKGSMQQVYDVLVSDMKAAHEADNSQPYVRRHKTAQEKEDFVKQNWHRSANARAIMMTLSKIDPATMTSEVEGDNVQEWTPNSNEEIEEWTPNNK